jgi:hypothetical protein
MKHRWTVNLPALWLVVVVVFFHTLYVSLFSCEYPFWDQWDQLHAQLAPWWAGHGQLAQLFAPHNEHRILFTRLTSMVLLWLNQGHWNNLVEAYVNTVIWAGGLTSFFMLAMRDTPRLAPRVAFCVVVTIFSALPFDWENTLPGFQNQFFYMFGSALLMVTCATQRPDSNARSAVMTLIGVASLFTMGAGVMTPIVGVLALGVRWVSNRQGSIRVALTMVILLSIAIAGLIILPHTAADAPRKATGITDHLHALLLVMAWPMTNLGGLRSLFVPLIWTPFVLGMFRLVRHGKRTEGECFLLGMACWVGLQAVAIAYARGHDMATVPWRYTDILVVGVMANIALAIRWIWAGAESPAQSRLAACWLGLAGVALGWIMLLRTPGDYAAMADRGRYTAIEAFHVSRFLASGDADQLKHPGLEIPYPSATVLEQYLRDPEIRQIIELDEAHPLGRVTRWAHRLRNSQRALARKLGFINVPSRFRASPVNAVITNRSTSHPQCTADSIIGHPSNGDIAISRGEPLAIMGWSVWPGHSSIPKGTSVLLLSGESHYIAPLDVLGKRQDVVRALHSPPKRTRAFASTSALDAVAPGRYAALIASIDGNNISTYCSLAITLSVTP